MLLLTFQNETELKRLTDFIDKDADRVDVDSKWSDVIYSLTEKLNLPSNGIDISLFEQLYSDKVYTCSKDEAFVLRQHTFWGNAEKLSPFAQDFDRNWRLLFSEWRHMCPVVLEGEPGSGKTSWITSFFSSEHFLTDNVAAIIDCSTEPAINTNRFTSPRVEKVYFQVFQAVSEALDRWCTTHRLDSSDWELENFTKLSSITIQEMIRKGIGLLYTFGKHVWAVIDNLDYIDVRKSLREEQATLVRTARSLMRDLKVETLVAVRPQTIRRGKSLREEFIREPVRPVQVPDYDFSAIVEKRLLLAKNDLAKFQNIKLKLYDTTGREYNFNNIPDFLNLYSDIGSKVIYNSCAQKFLIMIHNGDIGEVLYDLSESLKGSVMASEIVSSERDERRFITSYLRGDYKHCWVDNIKYVTNLFQLGTPTSPLLGLRILEQIVSQDSFSMRWSELLHVITTFGYFESEIEVTTRRLLHEKLIIDADHMTRWDEEIESRLLEPGEALYLTPKGFYHLKVLLYEIRYMSSVAEMHLFSKKIVTRFLSKGTDIGDVAHNIAVFLNELYKNVWNDLRMMEGTGGTKLVLRFLGYVQRIDGLFMGCTKSLLKSLCQVVKYKPQQISRETWSYWDRLVNLVILVEEWRKQAKHNSLPLEIALPQPSDIDEEMSENFIEKAKELRPNTSWIPEVFVIQMDSQA